MHTHMHMQPLEARSARQQSPPLALALTRTRALTLTLTLILIQARSARRDSPPLQLPPGSSYAGPCLKPGLAARAAPAAAAASLPEKAISSHVKSSGVAICLIGCEATGKHFWMEPTSPEPYTTLMLTIPGPMCSISGRP